jgi:hypothetical protein
MNFDNREKVCGALVVYITRSGTMGRMDLGSLEKAQFQMTISTERNVVDYSSK